MEETINAWSRQRMLRNEVLRRARESSDPQMITALVALAAEMRIEVGDIHPTTKRLLDRLALALDRGWKPSGRTDEDNAVNAVLDSWFDVGTPDAALPPRGR